MQNTRYSRRDENYLLEIILEIRPFNIKVIYGAALKTSRLNILESLKPSPSRIDIQSDRGKEIIYSFPIKKK